MKLSEIKGKIDAAVADGGISPDDRIFLIESLTTLQDAIQFQYERLSEVPDLDPPSTEELDELPNAIFGSVDGIMKMLEIDIVAKLTELGVKADVRDNKKDNAQKLFNALQEQK